MVAVAQARPRPRWRDLLEERRILAAVLIGPAVVFIVALVGGPLILSAYMSLTDATGGTLTGRWIGLHNFTDAWADPNFRRALRNTILFTLVSQAIVLVCAGLIAHALTRPVRGRLSSTCSSPSTCAALFTRVPIAGRGTFRILSPKAMFRKADMCG